MARRENYTTARGEVLPNIIVPVLEDKTATARMTADEKRALRDEHLLFIDMRGSLHFRDNSVTRELFPIEATE